MRAPGFWAKEPGLVAAVLSPLALIWTVVTRRRMSRPSFDPGVPVICVGNLNAGGTGKTPVVISVVEHLTGMGVTAHVVSRGYGGSLVGPVRVDERAHSADEVGDEPLLISAFGACWVAKDRAEGARAAVGADAEVIVLDDGFQNPDLVKAISIVVVDAAVGFGNGRVMPAGPLREPIADGLARADAVLVLGQPQTRSNFLEGFRFNGSVLEAELRPLQTGMDWQGLRVLAFAGIGRPQKFFNALKRAGADVVETRGFGDHASYRSDLLRRLLADAKSLNAQLLTTEKDAMRLPKEFRHQVLTFPVRLHLDDPQAFRALIGAVDAKAL